MAFREQIYFYTALSAFFLCAFLSCGIRTKASPSSKNISVPHIKHHEITDSLTSKGFFRFVESPQTVESISKVIDQKIAELNWLYFPSGFYLYEPEKVNEEYKGVESIDYRTLNVDGQSLFRGGLVSYLRDFEPIFTKRGLKLMIGAEKMDWFSESKFKHTININSNTYVMFDGEGKRGKSEIVYLRTLLEILNQELKQQNWEQEQFKVITAPYEGLYFMLLDERLSNYLKSLGPKINNEMIDKL